MRQAELDTPEHQRRLEKEAQEVCYGVLRDGLKPINCAEVQFTIGHGDTWDDTYEEFCGYFRVVMGEVDPWLVSSEMADAEMERRWPDATYRSIDDILAV